MGFERKGEVELKNGLFYEDDHLVYYVNDAPKHAGVIEIDGSVYYISSKGRAIKGQHIVHREMANGILKRGTYTFGEDYKLIRGSYIAPKKRKNSKKNNSNKRKYEKSSIADRIGRILKDKKNIAAIVSVLVFALFLGVAIRFANQRNQNKAGSSDGASAPASPRVKVVLPSFEDDVLLCSNAAKLEYDGEMDLKAAAESGAPYRPLYFEYSLENTSGILYLSEKKDLSDAREYELAEDEKYVAIDNLKVDTAYYYEAVVDGQSYTGNFHTAPSTRFVSIPGLVNTRDIGGYVNQDGKKVKQGLVIRGVELDGLVNAPYFIPEDELENVQDTFGFQYDLDLRQAILYSGEYTSRLGVEHAFYTAPQYGQIFHPSYRDSLRQIFKDLADPEKYPMYLHCTWGTDRTGTIIFLLQGVLNMSEEDMKREYLLTSYHSPSLADSTNMDVIINGLEHYDGNTLQDKVVSFLTTDIGVLEEEIESIRTIFLEN